MSLTCAEVQAKYPHHFSGPRGIECDDGWADLIVGFITELDKIPGGKDVVLFSIKEKFGRLRIDLDSVPDGVDSLAIYNLEDVFTDKSTKVCERCGAAGSIRAGSWLKTLCDFHEAECNR